MVFFVDPSLLLKEGNQQKDEVNKIIFPDIEQFNIRRPINFSLFDPTKIETVVRD